MKAMAIAHVVLALVAAPLLPGIINRCKAMFAGRKGQPLHQFYLDAWKLLQKGAVYSRTTTWLVAAGPVVGLAVVMTCLVLTPAGRMPAVFGFDGDLILLAYLLGLIRFMTVMAALNTGSSFEGMGASREVFYAALAEPAFLTGLAALSCLEGRFSMSDLSGMASIDAWRTFGPVYLLVLAAWFVVMLAENSRVPFDDPNTHLELTMIHEVMVLDHGGPDFAMIQYAASLKLWIYGSLMVGMMFPFPSGSIVWSALVFVAGMAVLAVLIGVLESVTARLRVVRTPQLLLGAFALSLVALLLAVSERGAHVG